MGEQSLAEAPRKRLNLNENLEFKLNFQYSNEDNMELFLEESVNFDHTFDVSKPRKTTKKQPLPFTTSTLQQKVY